VTQLSGVRALLESGRRHLFPSEMPTIPSAWEERLVGTKLESDFAFPVGMNVGFVHHPGLPRWAEWKCAVDAPQMIMRQPQFFVQSLQTKLPALNGAVTMVAAMRTPESVTAPGDDAAPAETLLLFARLDLAAPGRDRPGGDVNGLAAISRCEVETVIFDVPAAEKAAWAGVAEGTESQSRYELLRQRVKDGGAKIANHVTMAIQPGIRATLTSAEDVAHVTEGEPDYLEVPGRFRPTAIERQAVGVSWEVGILPHPAEDGQPPQFDLTQFLRFDTEPSRHATLPEMIAFAEKGHTSHGLPPLERFQETWKSLDAAMSPDKAYFIGWKQPPGEKNSDRGHVGFVRVRVIEN
jgi:hypothetical protein